jgi:hypothetical protein
LETIPIETFAEYVKSAFVSFFTKLIWTELSVIAPWVNTPLLKQLLKWSIEKGVTFLATQGGLVAFMINTKIFSVDQAKDYREALEKLNKLPDGVSDEEWEKTEREANLAFERLIRFSS